MDDCPELMLKTICCTCLSQDRALYQLCRVKDGVNNLYYLLSYDPEAFKEGFFKDTASLHICWECMAVMCKIVRFRQQVCDAQRTLTKLGDGQTDIKCYPALSRLTKYHTTRFKTIKHTTDNIEDNFIDCGPSTDIKSESEDDIPLSELYDNWQDDKNIPYEFLNKKYQPLKTEKEFNCQKFLKKEQITKKKTFFKGGSMKSKEYYSICNLNEQESKEFRVNIEMAGEFVNSKYKCESCLIIFNCKDELDSHIRYFHVEKPNHRKCDICLSYIDIETFDSHRGGHFEIYICNICEHRCEEFHKLLTHIENLHGIKSNKRKKDKKMTERKRISKETRTLLGYMCKECNKYFKNKNLRWKHTQQWHREGYKCNICEKRFAFNNNLARHKLLHERPPPREECPVCHKMIRTDLSKSHARIHSNRQTFQCAQCVKVFVSRESYEHHLKYTSPHAPQPALLRFKCSLCDRRYRSHGEMRDHYNYHHMGRTEHKCPICEKALATRRCIARHVRRAHEGVTEGTRNKICQKCGKAFRDKKSLREHELIHTGERPLSCELCGCTFRQSASLYTHRKRVHNICPPKKKLQLL